MRIPFISPKHRKPSPERELEWVRSLFAKFQRIQKYNTKALETMAEMDRALGGEYIFDRAFLESSVRELSGLVYQVAYSLNAMSRNGYIALYDRYQSIKITLEDILAGGMGPLSTSLALPYSILGAEMEPLAGGLNVCLAEARNRLDIPAPDGFAITVAGCSRLLRAIEAGEQDFPPELAEAITYQAEALLARSSRSLLLTVRICSSDRNLAIPEKIVEPGELLETCKLALTRYLAVEGHNQHGPVALAVHETMRAHLAGSLTSVTAAGPQAGLYCITAWPVDTPEQQETFFLRRTYPFDLVESELKAKPAGRPLYPGINPLSPGAKGLYRGSALLGLSFLRKIAECAAAFERILGYPQDLNWLRGDAERPITVNVSPTQLQERESADTPEYEDVALLPSQWLLSGGETAQMGVAAGPVVHVRGSELDKFPHGSVAVMTHASPWMSPVLRRAAAVVTEVGASIGHLATIARELRVPAIFGAAGALERLPEGTVVTVDAGAKTVYPGIVEHLLASRDYSTELYPSDPEYVMLRRLLRWIMPLDLIDPDSETFTVANCRTYHDIIHFAHERSIEELLKIQDNDPGLKSRYVRKLETDIPIDLFVLDIGAGVRPTAGASIRPEDVTSKPFLAFLQGLTLKDVWDHDSRPLSMRDIIAGLDHNFSTVMEVPEHAGKNHAILAGNYMDVGLRLGYHYCVIDSYLSGNVNQNYAYFRFAGGFAEPERRRRRAQLIRTILDRLRFKVTVRGDLVLGKLKLVDDRELTTVLGVLGQLTGFTRQIDLSMDSDGRVEQLAGLFREKTGLDQI
ncbi:MAG: PEP-utilizing enzyme [Syntrophobacteraceae bacterium]|nr:PEP-utilizing enzyme [Syntrophobacteraceae bacterium]